MSNKFRRRGKATSIRQALIMNVFASEKHRKIAIDSILSIFTCKLSRCFDIITTAMLLFTMSNCICLVLYQQWFLLFALLAGYPLLFTLSAILVFTCDLSCRRKSAIQAWHRESIKLFIQNTFFLAAIATSLILWQLEHKSADQFFFGLNGYQMRKVLIPLILVAVTCLIKTALVFHRNSNLYCGFGLLAIA